MNVLNQTHCIELERRDELHRDEVSYLANDAEDKIMSSLDQVSTLRKEMEKKDDIMKSMTTEKERARLQNVAKEKEIRADYDSKLENANRQLEQMELNLCTSREQHLLEREKMEENLNMLNEQLKESKTCVVKLREEISQKELSHTVKIDEIEAQCRLDVNEIKMQFKDEMEDMTCKVEAMKLKHEQQQHDEARDSKAQLERMKKSLMKEHHSKLHTLQCELQHQSSQLQAKYDDVCSTLKEKDEEIRKARGVNEDRAQQVTQLKKELREQMDQNVAKTEEYERDKVLLVRRLEESKANLDTMKRELEVSKLQNEVSAFILYVAVLLRHRLSPTASFLFTLVQ